MERVSESFVRWNGRKEDENVSWEKKLKRVSGVKQRGVAETGGKKKLKKERNRERGRKLRAPFGELQQQQKKKKERRSDSVKDAKNRGEQRIRKEEVETKKKRVSSFSS